MARRTQLIEVGDHDSHESLYNWDWLRARTTSDEEQASAFQEGIQLWGKEIASDPPVLSFEEVMDSDDGVKTWTSLIHRFGFCFVDGCPVSPEATQCLLERIAFIRTTHYGGFWDFTSDLASKDTAYTSLALEAHTDTTYFTDPAGLQMFHLLSHTEGSGGGSLLVDGFRAAKSFREHHSEACRLLSELSIPAHASGNEGVSISPSVGAFPAIRWPAADSQQTRLPLQIRWNNSDRATLSASDPRVGEWYEAARQWEKLLRSSSTEYWEQLQPGKPLIFDNWRVLHGRSAFTGKRRMCGGYINMDDFRSRWKLTNFGVDKVMADI